MATVLNTRDVTLRASVPRTLPIIGSSSSTSLLDSSNWEINTLGTQTGNGGSEWYELPTSATGYNAIRNLPGPDGFNTTMWESVSGTAVGVSGEGGIQLTNNVPIDPTRSYRFSVWVKFAGAMDGAVYLGCGYNTVRDIPSGTVNANPYFIAQSRSSYNGGEWYLLVGHILPTSYAGSQQNISGTYRGSDGQKIINGTDFKWVSGMSETFFRCFQYYTNGFGRVTYFANPRMDELNGTEPSLGTLLSDAILARANSAYTSAAAANTELADIASDNKLTPDEKPRVIMDRDVILDEKTGIDAQATAYGITTEKTNYGNAVTALTTYLATLTTPYIWTDLTQGHNTNIVGATFRTKFSDVYDTRQILLNKIAAVAGTKATWSIIDGSGKPSDNATSDIALVVTGTGLLLAGNSIDRPTGGGAWDAQCYSKDGFRGGAYASFIPSGAGTTNWFMAGLNTDPLTNASYTSLDYAFYMAAGDMLLRVYESGVSIGTIGTFVAGDVLSVIYDGVNVRYVQNGNVLRTVAAAPNIKYYFDSSIPSEGLRNIRFGPLSSNDWADFGNVNVVTDQIANNAATETLSLVSANSPSSTTIHRLFDPITFTAPVSCKIEVTVVGDFAVSGAAANWDYGGAYFAVGICPTADATNSGGGYWLGSGAGNLITGQNGATTTRATYTLRGTFDVVAGTSYKCGLIMHGNSIFMGPSWIANTYQATTYVTILKR